MSTQTLQTFMQLPFYGVDLLEMEFYNIQEYLGIVYQTRFCLAHALNSAIQRMLEDLWEEREAHQIYQRALPIVYCEEDDECVHLQAYNGSVKEDDEVIPPLLDHWDDL
ncbi:hypothetical protein VKT23_015218 [Stygiomarasmius scandens]|uniref:Uncharacterized protein n=1 Tax=Marasmiellus scandens TaxID=2682957 RepID=A0ABR1INQ0_9AGAR